METPEGGERVDSMLPRGANVNRSRGIDRIAAGSDGRLREDHIGDVFAGKGIIPVLAAVIQADVPAGGAVDLIGVFGDAPDGSLGNDTGAHGKAGRSGAREVVAGESLELVLGHAANFARGAAVLLEAGGL